MNCIFVHAGLLKSVKQILLKGVSVFITYHSHYFYYFYSIYQMSLIWRLRQTQIYLTGQPHEHKFTDYHLSFLSVL